MMSFKADNNVKVAVQFTDDSTKGSYQGALTPQRVGDYDSRFRLTAEDIQGLYLINT